MKKKFIVIIFFIISYINVFGQGTTYKEHFLYYNCGIGADGIITVIPYAGIAGGAGLTIFGLYTDFLYKDAQHARSMDVNKHYCESLYKIWHVGYQIPICKSITAIPLVGQCNIYTGTTDGSDWHIVNDHIVNKFYVETYNRYVDYGIKVNLNMLSLFKRSDTFCTCIMSLYGTRYVVGLSVGVFFNCKI